MASTELQLELQQVSLGPEVESQVPMTPQRKMSSERVLRSLTQQADTKSKEIAQDQYDSQAAQYKQSKLAPWRLHCEMHTMNVMVGDLRGKNVIDLACGDGHYSRWLKTTKDAGKVLGVDLSQGMIDLATAQEMAEPLGIEYVCCDAAKLGARSEGYDVVVAAYLLNYASTYEELLSFLTMVYNALPAGGMFYSVNNSPNDHQCHHPELRKYMFSKTCEDPVEGAAIQYTFYDEHDQPICTIDNYVLLRKTYDRAFRAAGFKRWGYSSLVVSPQGMAEFEDGYWDDLLDAQPVEGMFAQK